MGKRKQSESFDEESPASGERHLPPGWVWAAIDDIASVQGGIQKGKSRKPSDVLHEVPYLRVANVQRGYLDLSEVKTILATEQEIELLRLQPGDILFNEGGDRDKLGRGWVWSGEIADCIHQNHVFRARLQTGEILPRFVSWYANSEGQRYFFDEGKQTTNLASLNLTKLRGFPIPVPPPQEQTRIVETIETYFSKLDAAVEGLKRVQANLKRYRASVLKAAVEGRLVPTEAALARQEDRDYEPASVLLERILTERRRRWERAELAKLKAKGKAPRDDRWKARYKEPAAPNTSNLPALPEGWCWATTEMVGDVLLGRQRAPQYLTGKWSRPYLRVANVKDDRIDLSDVDEMDFDPVHFAKYRLEPGDILVSEGQSPELVGQSAIYRGGIDGLCFQKTLHRFRPVVGGVTSEFAQIVFRAHVRSGIFMRLASITTNIAHLTLEKFSKSRFPLPPAAEQARIVTAVQQQLSLIDEIEESTSIQLAR